MKQRGHKSKKPEIESGSAVFHHIGSVKFWLSPTNRLFLTQGLRVVFASLQGSTIVRYDDPAFKPGAKIEEFVRGVLRKQHEIRQNWLSPEEEELAFQYS